MGPWGASIMGFFGASFFAWSTVLGLGWRTPLLIVPVIVLLGIVCWAVYRIRRADSGAFEPSHRASKIIRWASIFEGVAIPIISAALSITGNFPLVLPGVALIVGLHFLPMAYAIPFRAFYGLAVILLLGAALGAVLPQPLGAMLAGMTAGCALWLASIAALIRSAPHDRL